MDEFARIATFFAPLATHPGAFGLQDDACALDVPRDCELVITQDTLVEAVHFKGDEPADLLAQKALRVNLSDLAGKGAEPLGYLLSLSLRETCDDDWVKQFAKGLQEDQAAFNIALLGGDSTHSPAGITLTITALGTCPKATPMRRRSGAKGGDAVFVSGTIGDAALALEYPDAFLQRRYQLPEPRTALIPLVRQYATAALDVSDGLLQDLNHLCTASSVKAELALEAIPLSAAAKGYVGDRPSALLDCATGGDDYEILFTASEADAPAVSEAANRAGVAVTRIGRVVEGEGISLTHHNASIALPARLGYRHGG